MIDARLEQVWNAHFLIDLRLTKDDRSIATRELHPLKAFSPISLTVGGIVIDTRERQP